ncbi:uncharacterized protein BO95DRAFT_130921 [Aspergillus brunneoviolaceus CBS 621.78]|uniref:Uncharacterized protein n=1 Tax=Aspergillus brunneoviolaceus CBS 621.78 TaxID=1450534 RepID=A0ACD1G941_9EURO|nr:hypothetical protein BO95DRAFT_130921 [Aspergillus brunneoviolaceus CBS 621.78]RAH45649.1 hypothetical protein BO95DRAFT_130921 [Aspergillus brunneoviolaceus CBS 621.78]
MDGISCELFLSLLILTSVSDLLITFPLLLSEHLLSPISKPEQRGSLPSFRGPCSHEDEKYRLPFLLPIVFLLSILGYIDRPDFCSFILRYFRYRPPRAGREELQQYTSTLIGNNTYHGPTLVSFSTVLCISVGFVTLAKPVLALRR